MDTNIDTIDTIIYYRYLVDFGGRSVSKKRLSFNINNILVGISKSMDFYDNFEDNMITFSL